MGNPAGRRSVTATANVRSVCFFAALFLLLIAVILVLFLQLSSRRDGGGGDWSFGTEDPQTLPNNPSGERDPEPHPYLTESKRASYRIVDTANSVRVGEEALSAGYAVLVDVGRGEVIAAKNADARIYPASMTKIMTLIVACDLIVDPEEQLVLDEESLRAAKDAGASVTGADEGDIFTVKDLLYAISLRSAGDAVNLLCRHLAGSEAAFVDRMNRKAAELGLTQTRFSNATGLHDENNYSTAREIASILCYAMDNSFLAQLLGTVQYETYLGYYKNGVYTTYRMIFYSTLFRDRLGEQGYSESPLSGYRILGGKTGFTNEAGYCLATMSEDSSGARYAVVTALGADKRSSVEDYRSLLGAYGKK